MYKVIQSFISDKRIYEIGDIIECPSLAMLDLKMVELEDPLNITNSLLTDISSHIVVSNN